MAIKTEIVGFEGAAGRIDCALDWPDGAPRGWALVLHPHSLQGGARDNKVVTTIARACQHHGLVTVRPDFRGVGASEGAFDKSVGETQDMLMLVAQFRERYPELAAKPWVLGGFSFGTSVAAGLHAGLAAAGDAHLPRAVILAGAAVQRFQPADIPAPPHVFMVHGEQDEVVPLAETMDWARARSLPIVVIPDASHFFHGKLLILRQLVLDRLTAALL
jgi:alpha/beta superfamily hydrolase